MRFIPKRLKKFWYSIFAIPYFDANFSQVGDEVRVEFDYNMAFIRHLDSLGYDQYPSVDIKLDYYFKSCWDASTNSEDDEAIEDFDL